MEVDDVIYVQTRILRNDDRCHLDLTTILLYSFLSLLNSKMYRRYNRIRFENTRGADEWR